MKVEFGEHDFKETRMVADSINKIDNINGSTAEKIMDDIYLPQPFFLSALLGFNFDISKVEHEEIIKIYLLIWEYFKINPKVQSVKITQKSFEDRCIKNTQMFKYVEGEQNKSAKKVIYANDLQKVKSKALLTMIILRFNTQPLLKDMNPEIRGMIMIGIKSFIECFETL